MRGLTRFLGAVCIALAGGCGLITGSEQDDAAAALRRAEARWHRAGVQDYQVVVQYGCFCVYTRPVRLTVRFGSVVAREDAETGAVAPPAAEHIRDITGLFDMIRDALQQKAHRLDVRYDATYGFPQRIDVDYIRNAVDDEIVVTTSQFFPLR